MFHSVKADHYARNQNTSSKYLGQVLTRTKFCPVYMKVERCISDSHLVQLSTELAQYILQKSMAAKLVNEWKIGILSEKSKKNYFPSGNKTGSSSTQSFNS